MQRCVTIAAALLLAITCMAQPQLAVRIGMVAGSPIPLSDIPAGSTGEAVPGLLGGLSIDVPVTDAFSIVVEPQFVKYASRFATVLDQQPYIDRVPIALPDGTVTTLDVSTTFTGVAVGAFNNNYLQLPVLARYALGSSWSVLAGGYLGWMMSTGSSATGTGTVGIRPEVVQRNLEFGNRMNTLDLGTQLGAQWKVFSDVSADFRVNYGLTSVFASDFITVQQRVHNVFAHFSVSMVIL